MREMEVFNKVWDSYTDSISTVQLRQKVQIMTMKQLNTILKKLAMKNLIKKFKGRSKKENRWI